MGGAGRDLSYLALELIPVGDVGANDPDSASAEGESKRGAETWRCPVLALEIARGREMPHYVTAVKTAWGAEEAFGFIADVRNFGRWDLRDRSVTTVDGDGLGSVYDVEVRTGLVPLVLQYEVVEWEAPRRLLLVARSTTRQSVDEIRVEPAGAGAVVTYDARLAMRGALRVVNPLLALAFGRIGDRAAAGLRRALGGEPPRLL